VIEGVAQARLVVRRTRIKGSRATHSFRFGGTSLNISDSLIEEGPGDKHGAIYAANVPGSNHTVMVGGAAC
jgi:hypothetical protein